MKQPDPASPDVAQPQAANATSELVSLDHYLQALGRTRSTFWRWERQGFVSSVNILGRKFITRQEIARFEAAAVRGELARERRVPRFSGLAIAEK